MKRFSAFFLGAALLCLSQSACAQQPNYPPKLKALYDQLDAQTVKKAAYKPLIGISCGSSINNNSAVSIELAGGVPVLLPNVKDVNDLNEILDQLDGVMLTGGEDVDPGYYGEEHSERLGKVNEPRDSFELMLFKKAYDRNMPIFAVCRGCQLTNIAMGGTLYQDIPTEHPSELNIKHGVFDQGPGPAHEINIVKGSLIEKMLGADHYGVNSRHHQGIKDLAPGLKITAWSPDSIPECVESTTKRPIFAVQFHPELMAAIGDKTHLHFFEYLVQQATLYHKTKKKRK